MSSFFMQQVGFIFLGSFLTFVATLLVAKLKDNRDRKEKEKNFKLINKLELKKIIKALEKLKTIYGLRNYFEYVTLESLEKSIKNLEDTHNDTIYLSNKVTQEKFIDLVSELSSFIASVKGVQNLFDIQQSLIANDKQNANKIKKGTARKESIFNNDKENAETFQQASTQKFIDLVEVFRRLDETVELLEEKS